MFVAQLADMIRGPVGLAQEVIRIKSILTMLVVAVALAPAASGASAPVEAADSGDSSEAVRGIFAELGGTENVDSDDPTSCECGGRIPCKVENCPMGTVPYCACSDLVSVCGCSLPL